MGTVVSIDYAAHRGGITAWRDTDRAQDAMRAYLDQMNDTLGAIYRYEGTYYDSICPRGGIGDGMPHQHGTPHGLEDVAAQLDEARRAILKMICQAEGIKDGALDLIDAAGLTDEERRAVVLRYLCPCPITLTTASGKERVIKYQARPWRDVAEETGKTYKAITRAHDRGMDKIERVIEGGIYYEKAN